MGFLINKKRHVNVTYCKPYKNGILSKSTRVQNPPDQNPPDQNPPAFKIHPILKNIFFIY